MAGIRVKVIGNYQNHLWIRQFPGRKPAWGDCEFFFDPALRDYDWLVVYNDFPGDANQQEAHPGCRENSLLVTTEPSTIKVYGSTYTGQFGHVLTSQPEWALRHPGRIFSQPALQWFYGLKGESSTCFDDLLEHPPTDKRADISTVCSSKKQRHTLHNRRLAFTKALKQRLPHLEIFGQGVRPIADRAEAIAPFRYHLAIENFIGLHHWTEKLADPFLGLALPFYIGCPNAWDYFPQESFIPLDIND
ncbi:MAG: glycosyltransferase, partial [Deltaproteobacteria bacterium]